MNPLKQRLGENRAIMGYLVSMANVQLVQVLARSGVDWLMIDMEHAPIGIESVAAMIAATGGTPATPIVRVPGPLSDALKPVLDCGAYGVVFPQVNTREEAEATVRAVRYSPRGGRGYGPTYAGLRWGVPSLEYLRIANDSILNVVLIESLAAVDALDDILSVNGLDIVAVARGDLSQNLGVAGNTTIRGWLRWWRGPRRRSWRAKVWPWAASPSMPWRPGRWSGGATASSCWAAMPD